MSWLEISTNIGCANKCVFCPQEKIIKKYSKRNGSFQMSFKNFKSCIDKVPKEVIIIFSGMSEPWLNKDCTKMVNYAHKKGHKIFIFTTLVGMKMSDIEKLKTISSFDYEYGFMVHLPSFEKIEKITITPEYKKVLRALAKSGIKAEYHYHGSKPNPKLDLSNISIVHTSLQNRAGNIPFKGQLVDCLKKGTIACQRSLKANLLLPNGDVLLCCQDYEMKHIIGNLLKSSYQSLFKGREYKKVSRGLKNDKLDILCRGCKAYAYPVENRSMIKNIKKKIKKIFLKYFSV